MKKLMTVLLLGGTIAIAVSGCTGEQPPTDGSSAMSPAAVAPGDKPTGTGTLAPAEPPAATGVTYTVEADTPDAISVSYAEIKDGDYQVTSNSNVALPFRFTVEGVTPADYGDNGLSLIAQSGGNATTIKCTISYDGKVLTEETASGPYGVAICNTTGS
ncbi:MmpS family protein [Microbacterium enclense]|uniref:Membrane protein n=1 Tax=Microbacterium enclense TaxID=993073 RepID=A0A1G6JHW1_9MICO|nr:MmpS family transport accessory protein [Microbacterium enclense]KSU54851.1 hypothetical protein AS029_07855 [Microbacterium enclense]MCM3613820.1 MmpS family protein [Microbacterium enclense]SDC18320.1 membrane protein [Microbacterium enclense]